MQTLVRARGNVVPETASSRSVLFLSLLRNAMRGSGKSLVICHRFWLFAPTASRASIRGLLYRKLNQFLFFVKSGFSRNWNGDWSARLFEYSVRFAEFVVAILVFFFFFKLFYIDSEYIMLLWFFSFRPISIGRN